MDMAELMDDAQKRGYMRNFAYADDRLHCSQTGTHFASDDCWIVGSQSVDEGTDPGDDATLYFIETRGGERGYLIVSDSFHADPDKAAFIDKLASHEPGSS